MKKLLLTFGITAMFGFCYGQNQKLTEYKASNGVTYKVSDTLRMGRGSGNNGRFVYVEMGGVLSMAANGGNTNNSDQRMGLALYANTKQIIKSIVRFSGGGNNKVVFYIKGDTEISIDEAISACEVIPCK